MKLVVITPERPVHNEAKLISSMLDCGVARVNLRHPGIDSVALRNILDGIPHRNMARVSLHGCHELAREYGTGIHLNSRNPVAPENFSGSLSISCHSIEEATRASGKQYYFISPVFPSISKPGYQPVIALDDYRKAFRNGYLDHRAVALGGVAPQNIHLLNEIGFNAVAMLGYVWNGSSERDIINKISILCSNL